MSKQVFFSLFLFALAIDGGENILSLVSPKIDDGSPTESAKISLHRDNGRVALCVGA